MPLLTTEMASAVERVPLGLFSVFLRSAVVPSRSSRKMVTMRRISASAGFSVDDAHTYEQLAALTEAERDAMLLPCDAMLAHLPRLDADADTVRRLACGQSAALPPNFAESFPDMFRQPESLAAHPLRIYAPDGRFAGLAHYVSGRLKALRMMSAAQEM